MSLIDNPNFVSFLETYNKKPERVIFFVGAGLSQPLFSSWKNLLIDLIEKTCQKGKLFVDKKELLDKVNKGETLLDIADYCADALGGNEYREQLEKHFDKEFGYEDIPEAYKILLKLKFKSLITTNYDRIPEIGGKGNYSCYTNQNISEALIAIEKDKKIVIKIHGDILDQKSIILTQSDFSKVINDNPSVQNALKSFFSTSTICFVGFGLSDPHLQSILENLNTINKDQGIIHYALLSSKSKFEIISLEKKFGIRVIEYADDESHHEVIEFMNHLSGLETKKDEKLNYNSEDDLVSYIENKILTLGIQNFYIEYDPDILPFHKKYLTINYFSRARTEYEQQREILSILKFFDFKTNLIDSIKICPFIRSEPEIEYSKFSPILFSCYAEYEKANLFARKEINEEIVWKDLVFNQPFMIGNIHFRDRRVIFQYINF